MGAEEEKVSAFKTLNTWDIACFKCEFYIFYMRITHPSL